jgi:type II secretory pathway pseudopilin PulG
MRSSAAYTLVELVVALAVAATLAAVAVPGVAWVHGRTAVNTDARRLAIVLRRAQARAAAVDDMVRVRLLDQGAAYVSEQRDGPQWFAFDRGGFEGLACTTNYPGAAVEFRPAGWPCAVGAGPRAGTFTFTCGGASSKVVLQMGGRVRWG